MPLWTRYGDIRDRPVQVATRPRISLRSIRATLPEFRRTYWRREGNTLSHKAFFAGENAPARVAMADAMSSSSVPCSLVIWATATNNQGDAADGRSEGPDAGRRPEGLHHHQ